LAKFEAGVLNDRMDRAETAIQKLSESMLALADSQKHTDEKLAALTDIVQRWYERDGNRGGGQHAS
jgi:hypothetical protein